jgi:hypothetical protein
LVPSEEGTCEVNGNTTVPVVVETGGDQVAAHVGLHALGAFADRLRLGDCLSALIPVAGERLPLHDRGKVLTQAMLMLAGGGESCADIEHLRAQPVLFGAVPEDLRTLCRPSSRLPRLYRAPTGKLTPASVRPRSALSERG